MTPEYLNECFSWNYEGKLIWKERPRSHFKRDSDHIRINSRCANKPAGSIHKKTGYFQVGVGRTTTGVHRVLYTLYHNIIIPNDLEIDHIDGNKLNNTFKNLRLGTTKQNSYNKTTMKNNTTGYKRVSLHSDKKRFRADIGYNGKQVYLGIFNTAEEAHEAYQIASVKYAGTFSNFG